ncbi:hypothetical protein CHARACLAT_014182, partial [Characodon lateralis]|nr:hypothetical protein [Characodon lateralis]
TPSHRKTNRTAGASHGIPTFPAFVFSLLTCQFLRDTSGCVRPEALPLFTHRSKRLARESHHPFITIATEL